MMKIARTLRLRAFASHAVFLLSLIGVAAVPANAQYHSSAAKWQALPSAYGPWNVSVLPSGDGFSAKLVAGDPVLKADASWTLLTWFRAEDPATAMELLAGVGSPSEDSPRYLAIAPGKAMLWLGRHNRLEGTATLSPGQWHLLAATFDGSHFRLYADGELIGSAGVLQPGKTAKGAALAIASVSPMLEVAPAPQPSYEAGPNGAAAPPPLSWQHFGGKVYGLKILRSALSTEAIHQLASSHPKFMLPVYEDASAFWPVQTRGQAGYSGPQPPSQMPHSKAPFSAPHAVPPPSGPAVVAQGANLWTLDGGWRLIAAPDVQADGAQISADSFDAKSWYAANVPGTVLTTLVKRGVYPNPYYGLNNLDIPETLNKQDYWYRTQFRAPKATQGKHLTLTFEGINYQADVWLNGRELGTVKGAFIRGVFNVTGILKPGAENVLAVRISPPPHPGIPQEQSIKGGPGGNGGIMCLDGPTFVATEGWDWIPGIRDRDSGIWQPVTLRATDQVSIGDPQVVTTLPLPSTASANVDITVPLRNASDTPVHAKLTAAFEGVSVTKEVELKAGANSVELTPAEFSQLDVQHPRLWWPNGYGPANLYHLKLTVQVDGQVSDVKKLHFGIRQITYELSLLDPTGNLRRVDYNPTAAYDAHQTAPVVNNTHDGIRTIPDADPPPPNYPAAWRANWHSWVQSLTPAGLHSPAIQPSTDEGTAPYLVIVVNGVRIAARGGNWGMDDAMKNVSRAHLEPYFRLHHDAGENIIRNWVGQSTEQTFYDLADKYGFLVWNDFWETTENYNLEPEDPQLFLKNAADVISRFRNHPSIAVWCGRNEGVPQPIINQGLDRLVRTLDGTRYYSPSSNAVDLQGSGPYSYQNPTWYYTVLNHGFSVETGTPSMSTLESFKAWTPKPDQWPMDDVWAYHDWHFAGNGDTHPYMAELQKEFGAPTSLADFERKAQMMDYVDYRAIFEGMNAHLWHPNSGRLLWMTQPAWPSNMWEVLSYDYDTQSSYYGEKEALQPLHIQLNLATDAVDVVNTTPDAPGSLEAVADVYSLGNKLLLHRQARVEVGADAETVAMQLDLAPLEKSAVVLVHLQLKDAAGKVVSHNLYWLAGKDRDFRQLSHLADASVAASASSSCDNGNCTVKVELKNTGSDVALQNKLTLVSATSGERILPAYYSNNYVSLLPGEAQTVTIHYPAEAAAGSAPGLTLRAFNMPQRTVTVSAGK
jgi:hypothetical protein